MVIPVKAHARATTHRTALAKEIPVMNTLYSRGRSLPFEQLLALGQLADVEFVSIQKGAGSEQCRTKNGLKFVSGQEA